MFQLGQKYIEGCLVWFGCTMDGDIVAVFGGNQIVFPVEDFEDYQFLRRDTGYNSTQRLLRAIMEHVSILYSEVDGEAEALIASLRPPPSTKTRPKLWVVK